MCLLKWSAYFVKVPNVCLDLIFFFFQPWHHFFAYENYNQPKRHIHIKFPVLIRVAFFCVNYVEIVSTKGLCTELALDRLFKSIKIVEPI